MLRSHFPVRTPAKESSRQQGYCPFLKQAWEGRNLLWAAECYWAGTSALNYWSPSHCWALSPNSSAAVLSTQSSRSGEKGQESESELYLLVMTTWTPSGFKRSVRAQLRRPSGRSLTSSVQRTDEWRSGFCLLVMYAGLQALRRSRPGSDFGNAKPNRK